MTLPLFVGVFIEEIEARIVSTDKRREKTHGIDAIILRERADTLDYCLNRLQKYEILFREFDWPPPLSEVDALHDLDQAARRFEAACSKPVKIRITFPK